MKNNKMLSIKWSICVLISTQLSFASSINYDRIDRLANAYDQKIVQINAFSEISRVGTTYFSNAISAGGSPVLGISIGVGLNKIIDVFDAKARSVQLELLEASLHGIQKEMGKDIFKNLNEEQRLSAYKKYSMVNIDKILSTASDLDQAGKSTFRDLVIKNLSDRSLVSSINIDKNTRDINTVFKDMVKLSKDFSRYSKNVEENFHALQEAQSKLSNSVLENSRSIDENTNNIFGIHNLLLSKMSALEITKALDNNLLPQSLFSENELKDIQQEAVKEEFLTAGSNFFGHLSNIGTIANNIGIKGLDSAMMKVQQGRVLFNSLLNMSINPLGAIASLSSLFGKRKNSNNGLNQALARIQKNQAMILENQSVLAENQNKILIGIREILDRQEKMYTKLSSQMSHQFHQVLGEFDEVKSKIDSVSSWVKFEFFQKGLNACLKTLKTLNHDQEQLVAYDNGLMSKHRFGDFRETFFKDQYKQIKICTDDLIAKFGNNLIPLLASQHLENSESTVYSEVSFLADNNYFYTKHIYPKLISLYKKISEDRYNELNIETLINPSIDIFDLASKQRKSQQVSLPSEDRNFVIQNIDKLLRPDLVFTTYSLSQKFAIFQSVNWNRIPEGSKALKSKDLFYLDNLIATKKYLKQLERNTNLSIAQENIARGDVLLPLIYSSLKQGKYVDEINEVLRLFGPNSLLVKNFSNYVLQTKYQGVAENTMASQDKCREYDKVTKASKNPLPYSLSWLEPVVGFVTRGHNLVSSWQLNTTNKNYPAEIMSSIQTKNSQMDKILDLSSSTFFQSDLGHIPLPVPTTRVICTGLMENRKSAYLEKLMDLRGELHSKIALLDVFIEELENDRSSLEEMELLLRF